MACVSPMPYLDVRHGLPSVAADLRILAANASARAEYKAQLQTQYETSPTFQQQFAILVAQLVHQQQRSLDLLNAPLLGDAVSSPPLTYTSSPLAPVSVPAPAPVPVRSPCTRPSYVSLNPRHRPTTVLLPPRPRLSSTLSPAPPHTLLPGPLRHPMPPQRTRASPMALRKQAVLNCAHRRAAVQDVNVDAMEVDDKMGQSWVVVPGEDWEMIDAASNL